MQHAAGAENHCKAGSERLVGCSLRGYSKRHISPGRVVPTRRTYPFDTFA
jgi:hypothetical protein